jgi:hypothetical protein
MNEINAANTERKWRMIRIEKSIEDAPDANSLQIIVNTFAYDENSVM